jgi:hypothetical protein
MYAIQTEVAKPTNAADVPPVDLVAKALNGDQKAFHRKSFG